MTAMFTFEEETELKIRFSGSCYPIIQEIVFPNYFGFSIANTIGFFCRNTAFCYWAGKRALKTTTTPFAHLQSLARQSWYKRIIKIQTTPFIEYLFIQINRIS